MRLSVRWRRSQRWRTASRWSGDTLIEVTLALAILSMVLITSTIVASQSYRLGQKAKERTAISNAAQGQIEDMRAFRDAHAWNEFLNGGTAPSAYPGVLTAAIGRNCHVTSPCLHMVSARGNTFVPADGPLAGPLPTSYLEIVVTPPEGSGAVPQSVNVTVNYGVTSLGGGADIAGHITTTFTNLRFAATPPPPPPAPPCVNGLTDIVMVLDTSGSMSNTSWSGNGTSRIDAMKQSASQFVDGAHIGPAANHIAVIDFNDQPTLDYLLGSDPAAAKAAISRFNAGGGTHYIPALTMAGNVLSGGRPGVNKVIVFLSDGQARDNNADQGVQQAMAQLPAGTKMYTIGIRADGENMNLLYNIMPMNGGFFGDATDASKLQQIIGAIVGSLTCAPIVPAPTATPFDPI